MKNLLLTLTVLFAFGVAAQAQDIKFENETIDYGVIEKDADGNREFVFTNTGSEPLIITNAKGSCGCTVPTFPKEPIAPGETAKIGVRYATNRVGRFTKTVTITSNASKAPTKVLKITGEVLPEPAQEGNIPLKKSSVIESNN